jgi:hypothetical protein
MALTLTCPNRAERQVTESKWDAAEQLLLSHPDVTQTTALQTPTHVYAVVRTPEGAVTRIRTKSQEETNPDVGLASPVGTGRVLDLLVGSSVSSHGTRM